MVATVSSGFGTHLMSKGAQQFCHSGGELGIKGQGLFPIGRYLSLGVPHPVVPSPQSLLTYLPTEFPFLLQQSRRSWRRGLLSQGPSMLQ